MAWRGEGTLHPDRVSYYSCHIHVLYCMRHEDTDMVFPEAVSQ